MNNEWLLEYYYPIGSKVKFKKTLHLETGVSTDENTIGTIESYTRIRKNCIPVIIVKIEQFNMQIAIIVDLVEII